MSPELMKKETMEDEEEREGDLTLDDIINKYSSDSGVEEGGEEKDKEKEDKKKVEA